jgi:hypothetical protein
METKEVRILITTTKPEADRIVRVLKAVKTANKQSAINVTDLEFFACCSGCKAKTTSRLQVEMSKKRKQDDDIDRKQEVRFAFARDGPRRGLISMWGLTSYASHY